MNEHLDMHCTDARRAIPSYLDGELTEAQAAPLRRHLLDCQPCRASAQSDKNLKRWFVEPEAAAVPRDFSARVARRAFAGESGGRFGTPTLVPAFAGGEVDEPLPRGIAPRALPAVAARSGDRNLRFVLALTAAAACALFVVSLSIQSLSVPNGSDLRAKDERVLSAEEALRRLDRLNAAESGTVAPTGAAAPAEGANAKDPRSGAGTKPTERRP